MSDDPAPTNPAPTDATPAQRAYQDSPDGTLRSYLRHCKPFASIIATLLVGSILITSAALALSSYGSLLAIPEFEDEHGDTPLLERYESFGNVFGLEGSLSDRRVTVQVSNTEVRVTLDAVTEFDSDLAEAVESGQYRDNPDLFSESYLAQITVRDATPVGPELRWSAPTVTTSTDASEHDLEAGHIALRTEARATTRGVPDAVTVGVQCFEPSCETKIQISGAGAGAHVTAVRGLSSPVKRTATEVSFQKKLSNDSPNLVVEFGGEDRPLDGPLVNIPSEIRTIVIGSAQTFWALLLFGVLAYWMRRDPSAQRLRRGLRAVLVLGLIGVVPFLLSALDAWRYDRAYPDGQPAQDDGWFATLMLHLGGYTAPTLAVLLATWAFTSAWMVSRPTGDAVAVRGNPTPPRGGGAPHPDGSTSASLTAVGAAANGSGRASAHRGTGNGRFGWAALVLALLTLGSACIGATALAWSLQIGDSREWNGLAGDPNVSVLVLPIATFVGFVGALIVAKAIGGRWSGAAFLGAVGGTGVLVATSIAEATYAVETKWTSGIITALVGLGAILGLLGWTLQSAGLRIPKGPLRVAVVTLVPVVAALTVIPESRGRGAPSPVSAFDAYSTVSLLSSAVQVALLTLVVAFLVRRDHRRPMLRGVVVTSASVLLFRADTNGQLVAWSLVTGIALVTFVLMPDRDGSGNRGEDGSSDRTASFRFRLVGPDQLTITTAVRHRVDAGGRARVYRGAVDALVEKVASGDVPVSEESAKRAAIEARFGVRKSAGTSGHTSATSPPATAGDVTALQWSGSGDPVERAKRGAALATLIGAVLSLPFAAQTLAALDGPVGREVLQPLLDLTLGFKYPLYGFVFGYFFPRIPGRTGLAKSLRLLVVLVAADVVTLLMPFAPSGVDAADVGSAVTLRVVQLGLVCLSLGVAADVWALRTAKLAASDLRDLYGTSRLVLWSSGVALAVATATATAMLGSAATLLVGGLLPDEPGPQVPSQTTNR